MGTQATTIASLFPLPGDHHKNPKPEDHLDAKLEFSQSRYPQQKHQDRRISETPIGTQRSPTRY